ncbi:MAG: ABC transporter ATP-binding protein [Parvularculaceae bacterium]|nr:ABC transporter ATP-binding protein [Parvularculaceae bacterium]
MSLVLKDVSRRFGDLAAVDAASLTVDAGEIVSLFGPSGCGKTTLLRVAAGLERPDAGTVELDGAMLSGPGVFAPPERRSMGFVFQDYVLFPHMTALENVAFGLGDLGAEERRRRAGAELAACGLDGLFDRRPHQLSGGQQQRVALARALVRRPKAMLLDEPFAAVDAVMRARLRDDVRRILKASGAVTILVTHDADEALALGDRIAIMREGRIIEAAAPSDLFERPGSPESALLFSGAQEIRAVAAGGRLKAPFADLETALPDGPVRLVLLPGASTFVAGEGFTVADCRFSGPGWRIDAVAAQIRLSGRSDRRLARGASVRPLFDPSLVRMFKA